MKEKRQFKSEKVLMIHDYPPCKGGGLEKNTFELSREFAYRGYSVTIATSRATSESFPKKEGIQKTEGVKIEIVNSLKQLHSSIKMSDIVHIHLTFSLREASIATMDYCCKLGKPFVVTMHTCHTHIPFSKIGSLSILERDYALWKLKEYIESKYCYLIAPAEIIFKSMNALNIYQGNHERISYGLGKRNRSKGKIWRERENDILYVGEVSEMKGIDHLLEAIVLITKVMPNLNITIVGEGPDLEQYRNFVRKERVDKNVTFTGFLENGSVLELMKSSKLYVLPSHTEVLNITLIEAMFSCATILASDIPSNTDLTRNGDLGFHFKDGDSQDLYRRMLYLLRMSNEERLRLAKRVRNFALKNFILKKQMLAIESIYKRHCLKESESGLESFLKSSSDRLDILRKMFFLSKL